MCALSAAPGAQTYLWTDPAARSPPRCHSDLSAQTQSYEWVPPSGHRLDTASLLAVIQCLRCGTESGHVVEEEICLTSHPTAPWRAASDAVNRHYRSRTERTERVILSRESTSSSSSSSSPVPHLHHHSDFQQRTSPEGERVNAW